MELLKRSSAEEIYNSLPPNVVLDLIRSLDSKKRTFPCVICFSPDITEDIDYIRDLYKFILICYEIYHNTDEVHIVYKMIMNAFYSDTGIEMLEDYILDTINSNIDKKIQNIEQELEYVINNTEIVIDKCDLDIEYSLTFKMGMGLEESSKFIDFLDLHNARRFFMIKQLPLFSLNKIYLGQDEGFKEHEIIDSSRHEIYYMDDERASKTTFIFK